MTDRLTPIVPHISPREDKPSKTTRTIRIVCALAVILFLGYYEIRAYYITHIAQPDYMSTLKEFEGTYDYSCDEDNVPLFLERFSLRPHPVFLPVITVSHNPFSISMPLQPPDGSTFDNYIPLHPYLPSSEPSYFYYESDRQIKILSPYGGQFTVIPITWSRGKFLIMPEDVQTLCQESLPDCYFYTRVRIQRIKGEPMYLDGTPLCQQ